MIRTRRYVVNVHWRCITINLLKQHSYGRHWLHNMMGKTVGTWKHLGIGADRQWDKFFAAYKTQ